MHISISVTFKFSTIRMRQDVFKSLHVGNDEESNRMMISRFLVWAKVAQIILPDIIHGVSVTVFLDERNI